MGERGRAAIHPRARAVNTLPKLDDEQTARLLAVATSTPPAGRARWTLRLLARRVVELGIVDHIAPETVRQALKKRVASLGQQAVCDSAGAGCGLCGPVGGCAGGLPASRLPHHPRRLLR